MDDNLRRPRSSPAFVIHNNSRINEDEVRMDAHTILPDRNSDRVSLLYVSSDTFDRFISNPWVVIRLCSRLVLPM